jgi:hypothetical protein
VSNVYWPRRPDLCNKDGRDCRKYNDVLFRLLKDGQEVGSVAITGDYALVMSKAVADAGLTWEREP